ncbi:hypothetical protein KKF84_07055 [Myxococcota bacterium]|nr:hypothetical protein [Myxococcota bacterium]MBU1535060.1 hypothetical protein [Myxococcota bacterium]
MRRLLIVFLLLVSFGCDDTSDGDNPYGEPDGGVLHNDPIDPADFTMSVLPEFRYGINKGHRNNSWGDSEMGDIAALAGVRSSRISLPERHLDTWGYTIEESDIQSYIANGIDRSLVAFLSGPAEQHSTAPSSAASWETDYYIPQNLYEPIWLEDGSVNPENYWASYVHQAVTIYHPWIRIWEVWNEPDWVSDWHHTLDWDTDPPAKEQLVRFNGSIFDYIRMLRITHEVVKSIDPQGLVATGGLGYPSFLSAILRYTDNPADGTVTETYPKGGGEYFDVLSFHHYPLFTAGNTDAGANSYVEHVTSFKDALIAQGYSGKYWITTESGAPHLELEGQPSGPAYARNYLIKVMALAQLERVSGIDWFLLTDTAAPGETDSAFSYMGLYEDIIDVEDPSGATKTVTGIAYTTMSGILGDFSVDFGATAALSIGEDARGVVFADGNGTTCYVLWALAAEGEEGSAQITLLETATLNRYEWDYSESGSTDVSVPAAGEHTLDLTSSPSFFITQ